MKILITGGGGFLGLHLANQARKNISEKKVELHLLDIANFDKKDYPDRCFFYQIDIRNKNKINRLFNKIKPNFVIHSAAALPLWKKEDIFSTNIEGTKNILESSFKNRVKRVIFVSSTAVYGVPKKHPILESDPLVGVGPYGESKILAENWCWHYIKKGLNITIIRPKTFVGPYRLGVFEILFDWIYDGKKIPVIGNGENRYQLLDVSDLVDAIYLFLEKNNQKKFNDVFNIGAEKFKTVKEDLEELFAYAYKKRKDKEGLKKSSIVKTPAFLVKKALFIFEKLKLSPLYQWVYDTADKDSYVSIEKIKKVLNWRPKYSNSDALIRAYQWYLDNYKEIKSNKSGITHRVGWKQGILGVIKKIM